jgi:hypothetical protein
LVPSAHSLFTGVHGAGESIRGTINDTLDQFGNGIASDGKSTTDEKRLNKLESSGHAQQNHANTVETGKQEMSEGLDAIGGKK